MALLHRADIKPTKLELLAAWLPGHDWYDKHEGDLVRVAGFRFDDPAGAVGVETLLVRAGTGPIWQVPMTYRNAPLDGADEWLVGTMEHSVLGQRWVYDATGDPVYARALAGALLAGAGQAEEFIAGEGGQQEPRQPDLTIAVEGAGVLPSADTGPVLRVVPGDPTVIVTEAVELSLIRRLGATDPAAVEGAAVLTGVWDGQPTPLPLAYATRR